MKGSGVDLNLATAALRVSQPGGGEAGVGPALAWQREMERAQMEAWLSHPVIASAGAAQPATANVAAATGSAPLTAAATPSNAPARSASPFDSMAASARSDCHAMARWMSADERERTNSSAHKQGIGQSTSASAKAAGISSAAFALEEPIQACEIPQPQAITTRGAVATATAQLASLLRDSGEVEATVSVAGQAMPEDASAALTAAPHESLTAIQDPSVQRLVGIDPVAAAPASTSLEMPANGETRIAPTFVASNEDRMKSAVSADIGVRAAKVVTTTGATAREPIRLHAHWSPDGVQLWLGMDASLAVTLQSVTAQLRRWLSVQGVRLLSISCNGRLVAYRPESAVADTFEADTHAGEASASPTDTYLHLKDMP
jgi:hypothetical protein